MVMLNVIRKEYHKAVCSELISYREDSDALSFIDEATAMSGELTRQMISKLSCAIGTRKLPPDTIGQRFAELTRTFIGQSLSVLGRPIIGEWIVSTTGVHMAVDAFGRHTTVADVQRVLVADPRLRIELNHYCVIAPDIIVARRVHHRDLTSLGPELACEERNIQPGTVSHRDAIYNYLLHAVISCHWTVRGPPDERRSVDVLNLFHNRRGSTPHIMAVTFEPLPARLASLALGTGDLDCMYHVALHELLEAIDEVGSSDHKEAIQSLVQGRRLRDISDLPLDLAV